MKKKIKKIVPTVVAFAMASAPFAVSAQWSSTIGGTGLPEASITDIVRNIMLWFLGIVGFIGIIGFVIAGILYLTAAGDEGKMESGKNAMTWSIVGVIVALMGYVIIGAVNNMLSGNHTF